MLSILPGKSVDSDLSTPGRVVHDEKCTHLYYFFKRAFLAPCLPIQIDSSTWASEVAVGKGTNPQYFDQNNFVEQVLESLIALSKVKILILMYSFGSILLFSICGYGLMPKIDVRTTDCYA